MTRALIRHAIAAGRLVQGPTRPVEQYVIAPLAIITLALILIGRLG